MENIANNSQKLTEEEMSIQKDLAEIKVGCDEALKENFKIPKVLSLLQKHLKTINKYIDKNKEKSKYVILYSSKDFVENILYCMGLDYRLSQGSSKE